MKGTVIMIFLFDLLLALALASCAPVPCARGGACQNNAIISGGGG